MKYIIAVSVFFSTTAYAADLDVLTNIDNAVACAASLHSYVIERSTTDTKFQQALVQVQLEDEKLRRLMSYYAGSKKQTIESVSATLEPKYQSLSAFIMDNPPPKSFLQRLKGKEKINPKDCAKAMNVATKTADSFSKKFMYRAITQYEMLRYDMVIQRSISAPPHPKATAAGAR